MKAWEEGSRGWREYSGKGESAIFPVHESWKTYKPASLAGESFISLPDKNKVLNIFNTELASYTDRELNYKVAEINKKINLKGATPVSLNKLGVLYARYGKNGKAVEQFEKVLGTSQFVPSLINMGNIKYLDKDIKGALSYYQQASFQEPDNPKSSCIDCQSIEGNRKIT